jgi:hypothetical protein
VTHPWSPAPTHPHPAPAPTGQPRVGLLAGLVAVLAALCCIGGVAAAFVVQREAGDAGGGSGGGKSHKTPSDPCALLTAAELTDQFGLQQASAHPARTGGCDFVFVRDQRSPSVESKLELDVLVGGKARSEYTKSAVRARPADCGLDAQLVRKVDPTGETADARLWCLDTDVYLALHFSGYRYNHFSGPELDDVMANLGKAALRRVPTA